jgi:hypothetical protein
MKANDRLAKKVLRVFAKQTANSGSAIVNGLLRKGRAYLYALVVMREARVIPRVSLEQRIVQRVHKNAENWT